MIVGKRGTPSSVGGAEKAKAQRMTPDARATAFTKLVHDSPAGLPVTLPQAAKALRTSERTTSRAAATAVERGAVRRAQGGGWLPATPEAQAA